MWLANVAPHRMRPSSVGTVGKRLTRDRLGVLADVAVAALSSEEVQEWQSGLLRGTHGVGPRGLNGGGFGHTAVGDEPLQLADGEANAPTDVDGRQRTGLDQLVQRRPSDAEQPRRLLRIDQQRPQPGIDTLSSQTPCSVRFRSHLYTGTNGSFQGNRRDVRNPCAEAGRDSFTSSGKRGYPG